jgi:hypothetical protein
MHKKNIVQCSISLDTVFPENYTFVSCNERSAAMTLDHRENRQNGNEESSQENGKEGSHKKEVTPTGKRRTGDASSVPRSALTRNPAIAK